MELISKDTAIRVVDSGRNRQQLVDMMRAVPPVNAIVIPEETTNGDALKAMFPSIENRLDERTGIMLVKWVDGTTKTFKASWWNAPYEEK